MILDISFGTVTLPMPKTMPIVENRHWKIFLINC